MTLSIRLRVPESADLQDIRYHVGRIEEATKIDGRNYGYVHYNYTDAYALGKNVSQPLRFDEGTPAEERAECIKLQR